MIFQRDLWENSSTGFEGGTQRLSPNHYTIPITSNREKNISVSVIPKFVGQKKKEKKKKNHNYLVTNVFLYASYTVCVNNYAYTHTIIQLFSASNRSGSFDTIQAY